MAKKEHMAEFVIAVILLFVGTMSALGALVVYFDISAVPFAVPMLGNLLWIVIGVTATFLIIGLALLFGSRHHA